MCVETEKLLAAQSAVGVALRGSGVTLKVLAHRSGINLNSLTGYFPADACKTPVQLPGGALLALCGVLPSDLYDLLLPDGFALVRIPEGVDHHATAQGFREYLAIKDAAHHPDSEDGEAIGPNENERLSAKLVSLGK